MVGNNSNTACIRVCGQLACSPAASNSFDTLHWRHNELDSVSNHQPHHCLLRRLFGRRSKKTSKLRVTGLCAGNSPGTGEFPHKWPVTRKMFPSDDVIMSRRSTVETVQPRTLAARMCEDGLWVLADDWGGIYWVYHIVTSSNENVFRVTGLLWGESIGHRWILTKASDAELLCFLWASDQTVGQTIETPAIWDAIALIMTSL